MFREQFSRCLQCTTILVYQPGMSTSYRDMVINMCIVKNSYKTHYLTYPRRCCYISPDYTVSPESFLAAILADTQLLQHSCDLSCSVVFIHVVLGRPTFCSGYNVNTVVYFLSTCPIHIHFLCAIVSLILDVLVLRFEFKL